MKTRLPWLMTMALLIAGCNPSTGGEKGERPIALQSSVQDVAWLTDFEEAQAQAAQTKKPILIDFSGSDWCGWCVRLDEQVFSQPAFKQYAQEHLVLFLADFPRKTAQSDELKRQNGELAKKYGVQGFPTVALLDHTGTLVGTTGYRKGGPEKYVEHLKELLKKAP